MLKLKEYAMLYGIDLNDHQLDQFQRYYDFLIEKNKQMNLTRITEKNSVILLHFIDSISIIKYYNDFSNYHLIDVGTGAGFPGIPLKIVFPDLNITLLDSLNKRVNFLNEVISMLELHNIQAFHGRAEDFAKNDSFRGQYDIAVSRAVANLSTLSEYCLPFVKVGGYFFAYKSETVDQEILQSKNTMKVLKGSILDVFKFDLPEQSGRRSIVKVKKIGHTPALYPRNSGIPLKKPLM